jgi:hypothetical protein
MNTEQKSSPKGENSAQLKEVEQQPHHSMKFSDDEQLWTRGWALRSSWWTPANPGGGTRPESMAAAKP